VPSATDAATAHRAAGVIPIRIPTVIVLTFRPGYSANAPVLTPNFSVSTPYP
jgi:hypothetical protein